MTKDPQRSNSVLFVLDELREIEDDRVRRQREEQVRREAERRAQQQRLAEERRRLEAEREQMQREREEQRAHELELAERRARIEAQMALEERRIAMEMARPAADVEIVPRARWPWALTAVAFAVLAAMQWMQWEVQQQLDRSINELRLTQTRLSAPRFLEQPTPPPAAPQVPVAAPESPVEQTPRDGGARRETPRPSRSTHPPKPPPPERIECDDVDDPLGCMPGATRRR